MIKKKSLIMSNEKTVLNAHLTFYVELPFNLGLPTGHYALNLRNQIKLHRDVYLLQKANEIENPSSIEVIMEPQERLFNDKGLCDEKFSDYKFKRKLRTVIYHRYSITYTLNEGDEVTFFQKLSTSQINVKSLNIPPPMILKFQKQFMCDINEFLKYYINFFPVNDIDNINQHEVRPLSIYEYSNCDLTCLFTYREVGIPLPKIIQDFNNQTGVPGLTYVNDKKIEEFEKVVLNRKDYPIMPYQEMFTLARAYYRSNKETLTSIIIVNSMTAIEAIFNKIESIDIDFQNFKISRNNARKRILHYYTDFNSSDLERYIRDHFDQEFKNIDESIQYLNCGRLIRNKIIHNTILNYDLNDDMIEFEHSGQVKRVEFKKLWEHLLNFYSAFNTYILKLLYPDINWTHNSDHENTVIGTATEDSQDGIVPIAPNRDWRETYSHNYDLPEFSVPPERFAASLETNDNKFFPLNFNPEKLEHEYIGEIFLDDKQALVNVMTYKVDKTLEELIQSRDNKEFNVKINNKNGKLKEIYLSCSNCGNICPLMHISQYKSKKCPKCKNLIIE